MPAALRDRAFQWGIGLAARLPTASRDGLGQEDGALGPAVAARWVGKRWSTGLQLLHEQALGGEGTADVTRVQPFVVRDLGAAWSMGAEADARYDWERHSLKGPLTVYLRRARGTWAFEAGARYWPDGPTPEPEWGLRIGATWVFE
ncbi:hypothetical protein [Agrilutibacter solisilvae]|uniref:Uncharacterized protein n=1 Tax=Agrilutibacter solisilvae TaxID=2763317 RepID=A0A974XXZ5_9GAMM|nr:hypothetical protein [Lysobacter solisilvae]QSX77826.1 hypothetical protein I8J32_014000 [Lysobacter solisilvae]